MSRMPCAPASRMWLLPSETMSIPARASPAIGWGRPRRPCPGCGSGTRSGTGLLEVRDGEVGRLISAGRPRRRRSAWCRAGPSRTRAVPAVAGDRHRAAVVQVVGVVAVVLIASAAPRSSPRSPAAKIVQAPRGCRPSCPRRSTAARGAARRRARRPASRRTARRHPRRAPARPGPTWSARRKPSQVPCLARSVMSRSRWPRDEMAAERPLAPSALQLRRRVGVDEHERREQGDGARRDARDVAPARDGGPAGAERGRPGRWRRRRRRAGEGGGLVTRPGDGRCGALRRDAAGLPTRRRLPTSAGPPGPGERRRGRARRTASRRLTSYGDADGTIDSPTAAPANRGRRTAPPRRAAADARGRGADGRAPRAGLRPGVVPRSRALMRSAYRAGRRSSRAGKGRPVRAGGRGEGEASDGGPDRIRTGDLQRDRLACWAATPRVRRPVAEHSR